MVLVFQVIDAGPLTGVEERQEEDLEKYSEQQLELAARRNMSIWRSHDGPTQREKFVRGESAFRNWLSRNKTFANVASDEAESEGAGSSEGDEGEEEDDDDGYCISYSKNGKTGHYRSFLVGSTDPISFSIGKIINPNLHCSFLPMRHAHIIILSFSLFYEYHH